MAVLDVPNVATTTARRCGTGFVRRWLEVQPAGPSPWWSCRRFLWPRLALAGGVAVLVVAAFVAGRYWQAPAPAAPVTAEASAAVVRERILLVAVGEHLERSRVVLAEVSTNRADGADLTAERVIGGGPRRHEPALSPDRGRERTSGHRVGPRRTGTDTRRNRQRPGHRVGGRTGRPPRPHRITGTSFQGHGARLAGAPAPAGCRGAVGPSEIVDVTDGHDAHTDSTHNPRGGLLRDCARPRGRNSPPFDGIAAAAAAQAARAVTMVAPFEPQAARPRGAGRGWGAAGVRGGRRGPRRRSHGPGSGGGRRHVASSGARSQAERERERVRVRAAAESRRGPVDLRERHGRARRRPLEPGCRGVRGSGSPERHRADGALYWKAYAEYKLAQKAAALATLQELKTSYPGEPVAQGSTLARSRDVGLHGGIGRRQAPTTNSSCWPSTA